LTMKTIRQNLAFAFFYNGLGIPLAVAGLLNPLIAVCAMFASSLSVIGNSLRIVKLSKRWTPQSGVEISEEQDQCGDLGGKF